MSFLYLDKYKVRCTEEGFTLKEVKKVWNNDKTGKEKTYFNDVITGIYFIYKPGGIYWNKPLNERIDMVNRDHVNGKWNDLIKRDGVQELIDKYRDLALTVNQRVIDGLKTDAEELLKYMEQIPMTIKYKIEKEIEVEDEEGKKRTVKIVKDITLPNMDKKKEVVEMGLSLSKMIRQVEDNLKVEENEAAKAEASRRMYDGRDSNKFTQPEDSEL